MIDNRASEFKFPDVAAVPVVPPIIQQIHKEGRADRASYFLFLHYLPEKLGEEPGVNFEFY